MSKVEQLQKEVERLRELHKNIKYTVRTQTRRYGAKCVDTKADGTKAYRVEYSVMVCYEDKMWSRRIYGLKGEGATLQQALEASMTGFQTLAIDGYSKVSRALSDLERHTKDRDIFIKRIRRWRTGWFEEKSNLQGETNLWYKLHRIGSNPYRVVMSLVSAIRKGRITYQEAVVRIKMGACELEEVTTD